MHCSMRTDQHVHQQQDRPANPSPHLQAAEHPNTQALTDLLDRLVKADLTASGYRLALDLLARMIRQGRGSECVPGEWLATRLGLHRNAVTSAFRQMVDAGLVRRIPVPQRGAPTRTTLIGPARDLIAATQATMRQETKVTAPADQRHENQTHVSSICVPARPKVVESPQPAHKPESQVTPNPALDIEAVMQATRSLPEQARLAAMSHRGRPEDLTIDPAWELTLEQSQAVRRLVPKDVPPKPNCTPRVAAAGEIASQPIAKALWQALPRLAQQTKCKKRAGELLDEIAYMVQVKGLGRGDNLGGVRAGIALVANGTWRTPRGFDNHWRGAVLRGVSATPLHKGDAQKTVH